MRFQIELKICPCSSGVERWSYTPDAGGSNPSVGMRGSLMYHVYKQQRDPRN